MDSVTPPFFVKIHVQLLIIFKVVSEFTCGTLYYYYYCCFSKIVIFKIGKWTSCRPMSVIILMINKSDSRDFVIICMIRDRIVLHSVLLTVLIFFLLQRLGDLCALAVANSRIDYKSARIPQAVKDILGRLVWTLLLSSGNLVDVFCTVLMSQVCIKNLDSSPFWRCLKSYKSL